MKTLALVFPVVHLFVLLFFFHNSIAAQQNSQNEIIYIRTDRENYFSGDTVWFKAFVLHPVSLTPSGNSRILYLSLYDSDGKKALYQKYLLKNGKVNGYFFFTDSLASGNYLLVANTGNSVKNFSGQIFSKKITFINNKVPAAHIFISLAPKIYKVNDTVSGMIEVRNSYGARYAGVDLSIALFQANQKISEIKVNTGVRGIVPFRVILPENLNKKALFLKAKVINVFQSQVKVFVPYEKAPPSIQFFPESGNALENQKNIIAFKAMNADGSPFDFVAEIVNTQSQVIRKISSKFMGMGVFELKYSNKDALYCRIIEPEGYTQKYFLPVAEDESYSFNAEIDSNLLKIRVNTSNNVTDSILKLTLSFNDSIFHREKINIRLKDRLFMYTDSFPVGVVTVDLYNATDQLLAERLVFMNKAKLSVSKIAGLKKQYKVKDKVHFLINLNDKNFRNDPFEISLSVFLKERNYSVTDNSNILSALLLRNELRGNILNPNFYFSDNAFADKALDLLLLTQGWRKIVKYTDQKNDSVPYTQQVALSGQVVKLNGKPVANAVITLVNYKTFNTAKINADEEGKFVIRTGDYLSVADTSSIAVIAAGPKNNKNVKIVVDTTFLNNIPATIIQEEIRKSSPEYFYTTKASIKKAETDSIYLNPFVQGDILIEDVDITARRIPVIPEEVYRKRYITYELKEEDIRNSISGTNSEPFLRMIQKAAGNFIVAGADGGKILFRGYNSILPQNQQGAIIVVDGVFMGYNYKVLDGLNPLDVESIKVTKSAAAGLRYSANATGGLIEIKTKNGYAPQKPQKPVKKAVNIIYVKGFLPYKVYYSPVYDMKTDEQTGLDQRKTIFWNPNVRFDPGGVTDIKFFTSDIPGEYILQFEGISKKGRVFYYEKTFEVK